MSINENNIVYDSDEMLDSQVLTSEIITTKKVEENKIIYRVLKRCLDILGGIVGMILLLPISLVVYIVRIVKKENQGPMFYDQLRIGKDGKEFKIYKYRTMVMHADEKLFKYLSENPEARQEYKRYKKLKNDPRITKIGNVLRKTSLDEFPQFINVIKGEMSLVGPRPYLYREKEDMGEKYHKIITCKPGITGYWQVNGRSDVDFEERLQMDSYYIDNQNLIMDIKILFKTVAKIFMRKGAI